jgi:hypothetical protein
MTIFIKKNLNLFTILFLILFFLNSCGIYKKTNVKDNPINDADKRAKNIAEGRGITGPKLNKSGVFNFATSNPMWRASIEVLDFTPLVSADYGGGILITDWYSDQNSSKDAYKITVVFLSNEIRADGLEVRVHKKICSDSFSCKVVNQKTTLNSEIKTAILIKAAQIEKEQIQKMVDKDKSYKKNVDPGAKVKK